MVPVFADSHDVSPEHSLLLAATRLTGVAKESIERALSIEVDWTRLVVLALAHRLAPSLLTLLETADPTLVPSDILQALRQHCQRLREQSSALAMELFELLEALEHQSVKAIPFKGPLLGEVLFGDIGQRSPGDLDLLVRRGDVTRFREVLEARGYVDADQQPGAPPLTDVQRQMYERFQCEYQYVRAADEIVVEPHWDLSQRPLAVDVDYVGMLDRSLPTLLNGRTVFLLAPADLLLALCVHGAKHHWTRLGWIRDLAGVLSKWPDLDLEAAIQRAGASGCARLLLLSLAVVRECAGVHLPPAVDHAIDHDPAIRVLLDEILDGMFQTDRSEPQNDRISSFRWRMRERWPDRLRYAGRTWLTPRRNHLEMVAFPRAAQWVYFPLKWGIDFAIKPAWAVVKPIIGQKVMRH